MPAHVIPADGSFAFSASSRNLGRVYTPGAPLCFRVLAHRGSVPFNPVIEAHDASEAAHKAQEIAALMPRSDGPFSVTTVEVKCWGNPHRTRERSAIARRAA